MTSTSDNIQLVLIVIYCLLLLTQLSLFVIDTFVYLLHRRISRLSEVALNIYCLCFNVNPHNFIFYFRNEEKRLGLKCAEKNFKP